MAGIVFPMALQNLFTSLVSASDALMLGGLSQTGLSAVSLATQVAFVHSLFVMAFMIGESTLAAQYWGKGDRETVERVLGLTLRYALAASAVFSLAALCVPGWLMRCFTSDKELIDAGSRYLRVVSPAYLLGGFSQVYLCIMKNSGRVKRSSLYGTLTVVMNLLLNALLIYGLLGLPSLGIAGAALATVLSRLLEAVLVALENHLPDRIHMHRAAVLHPEKGLVRAFWKITRPVLANELAWGGGVTMYSVIMGHLGNDAVAAHAVAGIVKNTVGCVASGFGNGVAILIGNRLGAGKLEQAKREGGKLVRMSLVIGSVSGLAVLLLLPLIRHLSGNLSDAAQAYLGSMLVICAFYMIGKSLNSTIIVGIFCAGGDTVFGFLSDLIAIWGVILPLGSLAAFVFSLPVPWVFLILSMDEFIKIPFEYRHYMQYRWVNNLTEGAQA
ncbi:MAG: MATE family efflux transporter [Clostridia bacterium]|nr:MATE family efflux transporter [Clostridia bacterium]